MNALFPLKTSRFLPELPKTNGAYFTPSLVVRALVRWAVHAATDRLLDPACGSGHFLAEHTSCVGIEQNGRSAAEAIRRAPTALVHERDFFSWAKETPERFDCAAGNPPFIRYQTFKGDVRERARALCARLGADFSGLSSSWAPFLVATASLLKAGGRLAFVVPAEIGHAPYSAPLLEYLVRNFALVHVIAVHEKLFPDLSEDCWLLYAEGCGGTTAHIDFSVLERFSYRDAPPMPATRIAVDHWRDVWNRRLRPFLIPEPVRALYQELALHPRTRRLADVAEVGIGYVTGANDFFHLRPSEAAAWNIPDAFLHASVRNGRILPETRLSSDTVAEWRRRDEPMLLLRLPKSAVLSAGVRRYLATDDAAQARQAYKCRMRDPWYSVPDVRVPDFFLTYMSGRQVSLVRNDAAATCTNSLHAVKAKDGKALRRLLKIREDPTFQLSSELEGHPLGGGMLKLEPREAGRILLPNKAELNKIDLQIVESGTAALRAWRHYAA